MILNKRATELLYTNFKNGQGRALPLLSAFIKHPSKVAGYKETFIKKHFWLYL